MSQWIPGYSGSRRYTRCTPWHRDETAHQPKKIRASDYHRLRIGRDRARSTSLAAELGLQSRLRARWLPLIPLSDPRTGNMPVADTSRREQP